jgi:SAM-dependent methyltransferase
MRFFDRVRESFHYGRYGKAMELIGSFRGGRLLDIGCGRPCESMGDFSFTSYAGGGVGADICRCGPPPPGCLFVKCDVLALPFRGGCFDVVAAMELLEHVEDLDLALQEIRRILSDGGIFVVSTPSNNLLWRALWFVWVRTFGRMWFGTHKTNLGSDEWLRRLGEHFRVTGVRRHWNIDLIVRMDKEKS